MSMLHDTRTLHASMLSMLHVCIHVHTHLHVHTPYMHTHPYTYTTRIHTLQSGRSSAIGKDRSSKAVLSGPTARR